MEKQSVTTGESPKVTIKAQGELTIKGWHEDRVLVKNSAEEHITIEQDGDNVLVNCLASCSVRMPYDAEISLQVAKGRAVIKNVEGKLDVEQAHGDLVLKSVGPTKVGEVKGNLNVRNVFGELNVTKVMGNASVKDVQGNCALETVHGNLQLDDVDGAASADVFGNVILRFGPLRGNEYNFSAKGNLQLSLSDDISARIMATCKNKLIVKLPGVERNQSESGVQEFTLGDGDATIILSADGNLRLLSTAPDWQMGDFAAEMGDWSAKMGEDFSEQITQQIEAQMEMMAEQIELQMESLTASLGTMGMSEEQRRHIEERAQRASERAAIRAQEKMRKAQERMRSKLEAAQRRAERRAAKGGYHPHPHPMPSVPNIPPIPHLRTKERRVNEPVSEDERMAVLRMLEENKITLEQADELLAALEGKE